MFVRFTPINQGGLELLIEPQDFNPQNEPMPSFEIQLADHWNQLPELMQLHGIFAIQIAEQQIQIEIDANNVFSIWHLNQPNEPELLYATPIISPQLAEEVRHQFREGMPEFEVIYSRFAENNDNNASTVTLNSVNYINNINNINNMRGGERLYRKPLARHTRRRKYRLRKTRKN